MPSRLGKTIAIGIIVTGVCAGQNGRASRTAASPLTFAQIEQLIKVGTPDAVISQEVRDRGAATPPTNADLDRLAARGAGGQTLAALRALARGVITVTSRPGDSEVLVDGKPAGKTQADGRLSVNSVPAGDHLVVVQKDGFRPAEFSIRLDPGGNASVAAALEAVAGLLNITTNLPDSTIRINGAAAHRGEAHGVRCPSGSCSIEVTAPRYAAVRRTVEVPSGQTIQLEIKLEPDGAALDDLRQRLRSSGRERNATSLIRTAEELLRYAPADGEANAALAAGAFAAGDTARFRSAAAKALEHGGTIQLRLLHHHAMMLAHEAAVSLQSEGIAFDPLGNSCSLRPGKVPALWLSQAQISAERVREGQRYSVKNFVDIRFRPEGRENKTTSIKVTDPAREELPLLEALAEIVQGLVKK
jgi:PEGA domain-containing protein